ncbi:interferon omega-2-like [Phyllostomus hastatus]|uniref:interferon omega-2-like n=1 Tax=Phyllostomus hastatus TaxID=9423 RepID=UPI001E6828A6|nr:interferon omega-2-like [Phyllostomus hastatus]XP_045696786.1 interferon omega-2-like [Phyllostomus hastatus]XP_045696787.1 interferon omega-2-like [Phyllostomus hastatus]
MALPLSLLTVLVVFSCGPSGALGCVLPQNHILLSKENLVLLRQMQRISTLPCLKDKKDFRFPRKMVNGSQVQEAQAISVLHGMLQDISDLLLTEHASAAWNTTLLNQLRMGLYQQLEDLEPCLLQEMGEGGTALPSQGPTLDVRYFEYLFRYLEKKQYSDCAWEVVRVEIMRSLSSIRTLQERLSNMD